jgi:hypothetical protein
VGGGFFLLGQVCGRFDSFPIAHPGDFCR